MDYLGTFADSMAFIVPSQDFNTSLPIPGRDGRYSRGKEGGKVNISKREFLAWIFSDHPFDEKIYGADIRSDAEWVGLIQRARDAALIEKHFIGKFPQTETKGVSITFSPTAQNQ